MLSTKKLVFKGRPTKKLMKRYVRLYIVEEILENAIKLKLLAFMWIHPVVNISWVVRYKKQVEEQKKEEVKLVEVKRVKEWKVEIILNKRKVRGVVEYLVQWNRFTVEYDIWER